MQRLVHNHNTGATLGRISVSIGIRVAAEDGAAILGPKKL